MSQVKITLITVVGGDVGMLPHMLAHYKSMGVTRFIIHAHAQSDGSDKLKDIAAIAASFDAEIASSHTGPFLLELNPLLYSIPRSEAPLEWFVLADQDELQVYPDGRRDTIRYCDQNGYDFVEGCLVDRVSDTGILTPIDPGLAIWGQFPFGALVSARILGAVTNKIVAVRGHVRVGSGQHHAISGVGCPPSEIYVPVHHFKWVESLLPNLKSRLATVHRGLYSNECGRFLSYYEQDERIKLETPALLAARCDHDYPNWSVLRNWRLAAASFSVGLAMRERRIAGP